MKVIDLIEKLSRLDPEQMDSDILAYDWDSDDYTKWGVKVTVRKDGVCIGLE